jgi:hypothetical protein
VSICSDPLLLEWPSLMKFEMNGCPILELYFIPTYNDAKCDKSIRRHSLIEESFFQT